MVMLLNIPRWAPSNFNTNQTEPFGSTLFSLASEAYYIHYLTSIRFWMTCFYCSQTLCKNGLIILISIGLILPSLCPCNFQKVKPFLKCFNLENSYAVYMGISVHPDGCFLAAIIIFSKQTEQCMSCPSFSEKKSPEST